MKGTTRACVTVANAAKAKVEPRSGHDISLCCSLEALMFVHVDVTAMTRHIHMPPKSVTWYCKQTEALARLAGVVHCNALTVVLVWAIAMQLRMTIV